MTNWINEGEPVYLGENAAVPLTVTFPWATALGTPTITAYREGNATNVADTVMPSGSHTTSGNQLTLKAFSGGTGGETYILSIVIAVDSVTDEWFLKVGVLKKETGRMT